MRLVAAVIRALGSTGSFAAPVADRANDWAPVILGCMALGFVGCVVACLLMQQMSHSYATAEAARYPCQDTEQTKAPACHPARVWAITSINVSWGFSVAALGLIVVPLEAKHIWPEDQAKALGILSAFLGIGQLIGPKAGQWSDTCRCYFGGRRPLLILMACLSWVLSFFLWYLSLREFQVTFLFVWLILQLALNILHSAQAGLVPDLVPEDQQDFAGGAAAANTLIGAVAACAYVHVTRQLDYHTAYAAVAVVVAFSTALACATAKETHTHSSLALKAEIVASDGSTIVGGWSSQLIHDYSFDYQRYPNFARLLVMKTIFSAVVMVKVFLMLFYQDLFKSLPASMYIDMVGQTAVVSEISATLAAVAVMLWMTAEDPSKNNRHVSRGRSLCLLRTGIAWMALSFLAPAIIGEEANAQGKEGNEDGEALEHRWFGSILRCFAIWGLGQGDRKSVV